jgi:hypothetical protein
MTRLESLATKTLSGSSLLAKRAPDQDLMELIDYRLHCLVEDSDVITKDFSAAPDPEETILQQNLLKMYGLQPLSKSASRAGDPREIDRSGHARKNRPAARAHDFADESRWRRVGKEREESQVGCDRSIPATEICGRR